MRKYAIPMGTMKVTSDKPIPEELRKACIKAVREALAEMETDLGAGFSLVFDVVKD